MLLKIYVITYYCFWFNILLKTSLLDPRGVEKYIKNGLTVCLRAGLDFKKLWIKFAP